MSSRDLILIKQRVKEQFSKSTKTYETKATFQKMVAEELLYNIILPLATQNAERRTHILDIGCGTGFLTAPLTEIFCNAKISACDIAFPMVMSAMAKTGLKLFLAADCEELPYKNQIFDLIASNLTYQWACNMNVALKEAYRVMKQGGIFAFSILGRETFKEMRVCYREANLLTKRNGIPQFVRFYSKDDLFSILKDAGFEDIDIKTELKSEPYNNLFDLLKRLKAIGAGNPFDGNENSLGRGMILKRMADIYKERFKIGSGIYATYEVIFVTAKRPI